MFIGRTDVEAETPILWPPDVKNWLIWKDPDAGKDWRQEEKGKTKDKMVGWDQFSSVQFSHSVMSNFLWPPELQHARPPCPSPTLGVNPNSCPMSRCCHPTIYSSVVHYSSHPQSFPTSGYFQESALLIRWPKYWSFSLSISPSNEHPGWPPLGWTGWISLQSKGLSRVFSNTTVQKHQLFSAQLSL